MRRLRSFILGLVIVLMLAAFNHWLFTTWFGITYLDWYLKNGALIGLVTAGVALTWGDMNKHTGLISAHPLVYVGACLQLVGIPLLVMGTHLRSNPDNRKPRSLFDALVTVLLVLILTGGMLVWLVVVVPLQYFVYLICGAPARFFSQSTRRAIAQLKDGRLQVAEIGQAEKVPDGWWDASIVSKPVPITNLFTALFFLILKMVLGG